MSEPAAIDLFVEDRAHEEFLRALVERVARDVQRRVVVTIRSARGGHGRAIAELELYQRAVASGSLGLRLPDLLVVGIDSNCSPWNRAVRGIRARVHQDFLDRTAVACPEPHIERWYLADPDSFAEVVGSRPRGGKRKCERARYKRLLAEAVEKGGHTSPLGGIEFAPDLVAAMDLHRAGKMERSLKLFLDEATPLIKPK